MSNMAGWFTMNPQLSEAIKKTVAQQASPAVTGYQWSQTDPNNTPLATQLMNSEAARGGAGQPSVRRNEPMPSPGLPSDQMVPSTTTQIPNVWNLPNTSIWANNQQGERNLWGGAINPLSKMTDLLLGNYNQLKAQDNTVSGQLSSMQGMAPALQQLMGITPDQQAQYLQGYRDLQQPARTQQQAGLGNSMAAMGMGGGRLARALAQMQGGYANEDAQVAQQLLGRNMDTNNQIGQMLFGGAQTQVGQNNQVLQSLLSMLQGTAGQMSALPLQVEQVFKQQAA